MTETQRTYWDAYIHPVIRYVVELGEAFVLAIFFYVASNQIDSIILKVFSYCLFLVVACLAGLPLGFAIREIGKIKTKDWRIMLLISVPAGAMMAFVCQRIGFETADLIRSLASIQVK